MDLTTHTAGLAAMRRLIGLDVPEMAEACDRDPFWLSRVEKGQQPVSLQTLGNLAAAYASIIAQRPAVAQSTST